MRLHDLAIYRGTLKHHRTHPIAHRFEYKVFQIWLNINKLYLVDQISRFWSVNRFNLVRFNRQNFMPSPLPIFEEVKQKIQHHSGKTFDGDVYLLANLSYWGHGYNPASFYACYESGSLTYFICEIHNTPWGERFSYVHDLNQDASDTEGVHVAQFEKRFHVSPFMPMNLEYEWQYRLEADRVLISMNLIEQGKQIFNSTLSLKGKALSRKEASLLPFKYPFMCIKVLFGIYWQAIRLWLKGVRFHRHPNSPKPHDKHTPV